jgi:hypothetical protein
MKATVMICSVVLLLGLISCTEPNSPGTTQRPTDSVDTVPLSIGASWTYAFYDVNSMNADTIHIYITRGYQFDSSTSSFFAEIVSTNLSDSMLITVRGDTIDFLPYNHSLLPDMRLVLPITLDKEWQSSSRSYRVIGADTLTTGDTTYSGAINVKQFGGGGFNCYEANEYWIVDDVGIVKIALGAFCTIGTAHHYRTWQLLRYLPGHAKMPSSAMQKTSAEDEAKRRTRLTQRV